MARDPDGEQEMGAGGKLTRRSLRSRISASPYARPPATEKNKSGWLSKLLIKPAARILPSLFSSSSSSSSSQQLQDQDQDVDRDEDRDEDRDPDAPHPATEQEHSAVYRLSSDNQFSEPKESDDAPAGYASNDHGIAEIEQQLQQKKFSRDETEHLIELLRSRTTDLRNEDGPATVLKVEPTEVVLGHKDLRNLVKEDSREQFNCTMMQNSPEHFQFKGNDASTSPVEIAKAYMEARIPTSGYNCETGRLKNEKSSFFTDNAASKLPFTPVAKSPMCWPGAIMQGDHGYFTPQKGGIVHYPRTPYSHSVFSKSTSKLQVNSEGPTRSSAARSSAHVFGHNTKTVTRANSILDNGVAPVSPVHHIREKNIASASKGAIPSTRTTSFSLQSKSNASSGFLSATRRDSSLKGDFYNFHQDDVMDESSRFAANSTPVHPQSSVMARKILEHLDRSVPSSKEKLLEINLARKRVPPNSETLVIGAHQDRSDTSTTDEHQKAGCLLGRDVVPQELVDAHKVLPGNPTSMVNDTGRLSSLARSSNQGMSAFAQGTTPASCSSFQIPESRANTATFQMPKNRVNSAVYQAEGVSHSSDETSIPPNKLSKKPKSSDNGFNFTFPISAAPSAFSEPPPTPTMPSSPVATSTAPNAGEGSVPSFSFGSSKSSDRLAFSFGSAVSSSDVDISTPSFKFGDEKKSRLSFKTVSRDSICY